MLTWSQVIVPQKLNIISNEANSQERKFIFKYEIKFAGMTEIKLMMVDEKGELQVVRQDQRVDESGPHSGNFKNLKTGKYLLIIESKKAVKEISFSID